MSARAPRSGFVGVVAWMGIAFGVMLALVGVAMDYAFDALLGGPQLDEDLAKVAEKGDQVEAKKSHQVVKNSCADCHKVFRKEDDF